MHRLSYLGAALVLCLVSPAWADETTDAGISDAAPQDAEPAPSPPATEPAPPPETQTPTPTPAAESDDGDKHHKKKKKKHQQPHEDGSGDEAVHTLDGDMISDHNEQVGPGVGFRFLFQTRYTKTIVPTIDQTTTLDPRLNDGYALNRVFLRATTQPKPWLAGKLLVDFAELSHKSPKHALKLAYAELKPHSRVTLTVGLFKRTFSLLELLPIADYELADPGPTDSLIKDGELAGRDPGAMIRIDPLRKRKWLSIYLGMYDGGLGGVDARLAGLLTGRIEGRPTKHIRLGIDGAWRHRGATSPPGIPTTTGPARAISVDARYTRKKFELRAEWLWGQRGDVLYAGEAKTFMAAWAIVAAHINTCRVRLTPAARFEWLDADREHGIGRRYVASGALNVGDLADNLRFLVDVSRTQVEAGSYPLGQIPLLLDHSATTVVGQLQLKI
jgi:hypothetical protein